MSRLRRPSSASRATAPCAPAAARTWTARRALTLIELIVSMALAGILFSSVIASFLMILRSSRDIEIQTTAISNARAALDNLTVDLKQAAGSPFLGTSLALDHGDRIDNSIPPNGLVDEETQYPPIDLSQARLNRAQLSNSTTLTLFERPEQAIAGHYGDFAVAVDPVFHQDTLEFVVSPLASPPYRVLYQIEKFDTDRPDALPTVLTRTVTTPTTTTVSPVAYDVLSFRCLFWDSGLTPVPDWAESWPGPTPPDSVLVEITVYADPSPFEKYRAADPKPVRTATLRTAVNPAPQRPNGLIAHWRFDDTGLVAFDSSGQNHDLALAPGMVPATVWQPGYLGGCLTFNGTSAYAQTTNDSDLFASSNDVTIAFWVKPAASQQAGATILDCDHNGGGGQNLAIVQSATGGPNSYALVYQSGAISVGDTPPFTLYTTLTADTWQHFAIVKTATTLTHYLNGHAVGSITVPNPLKNGAARVSVGAAVAGGNNFAGQLDDMRIYSRALLPGEVAALAQ